MFCTDANIDMNRRRNRNRHTIFRKLVGNAQMPYLETRDVHWD